jgi:hypothetical protein
MTALVGPDGKEYDFDGTPEELNAAQAKGFRILTPDAPRTALEEAKAEYAGPMAAGALGALEGLTGGGYGAVVGATAPTDIKQAVIKTREENPTASLVGEGAGMLLSPLNKAGSMVTKSLGATTRLGRIGAEMAGGLATGTLFGAGKTIGDAALGDADLTAEMLLSGAGLGGLLGAGGSGVFGAISEGARLVLPGVKSLASRAAGALDDIANDAAISSTRATQAVINRVGDKRLPEVARVLRERGHLKMTPEQMAESVAKDREGLGKLLGKFLDDADKGGSKADHMRLLNRLDDFEAKLNPLERDAIGSDLSAARKAVAELGEQGSGFRALDDLKQTIQAKAKFSRGPTPLDDTTLGLKRSLAGVFRDELDQQLLPVLGADAGKTFTESKALYGALKDAERLAQSGMSRVGERGGFGYVGLKDLVAGAAGAAVHPLGMAAALGSKVMREHGNAIVARIADRLAKEPALQAVAQSFAASLPQTAPRLGRFGPALMNAAQQSPAHALATHMAYAQLDPEYASHAQLAGLEPEQPDEHDAALKRAQSMAEAQAALKAQEDTLKRAVDRVFRGGGSGAASPFASQDFGAKRMRRDSSAAYLQRVNEVRELATNPEALIERVSANLGPVATMAPAVGASLTATASRAVAYLAQQAEVPPKPGPLAPEWDPPEADRFMFAAKLEAIQDPMSVLDAAASGELIEEQVEALKAVYPRLARQMADLALERMTAAPHEVPYSARLMLDMLTGIDPDGTFSGEAVSRNQTAIAASTARDSSGAQGAPEGDGFTLASRSATPSQRRELRDE